MLQAAAVDTERANEARLRRFVEEVLDTGDVDAADEFIAAEFVDHSLPPDVPGTLDGFKEWFSMFHAAFPDARWEIGVLLSRGDLVALSRRSGLRISASTPALHRRAGR